LKKVRKSSCHWAGDEAMHGNSKSTQWFRIELLGHFRVTEHGAAERRLRIRSRRGQALLAHLALHPGRAIPRAKLAALLWEDHSESSARHNLRQLLTELRSEMGPLLDAGIEKESLEFSGELFRSDVSDFLTHGKKSDADSIKSTAEIYAGELFDPGPVSSAYDDWISTERRKLHSLALNVFETRVGHLIEEENHREALSVCERMFALDPLREETHRLLISLEAAVNGLRPANKRAKELAALLRTELGVPPEPQTLELLASLAANRTTVNATIARAIPVKSPLQTRRVAFAGATLASALFAIALTTDLYRPFGEKHPPYDELISRGFAEIAKAKPFDAGIDTAYSLFSKALKAKPDSAYAKLGIGRVLLQRIYEGRSEDRESDIARADRMLSDAAKDAPSLHQAHYLLGVVRKHQGRFEESITLFQHALRLHPNYANAHAQLGHSLLYLGRAEETEHHIRRAFSFSPEDPSRDTWYFFAGQADVHLDKYESAIEWLERGLELNPKAPLGLTLLTAAQILQGEKAKAAATVRKLKQYFPDFSVDDIQKLNGGYTHPEFTPQRNKIMAAVQSALDIVQASER
jgi:DNA-binding SARP family transcriptional activator/Tfp pilus assembly protein PilF